MFQYRSRRPLLVQTVLTAGVYWRAGVYQTLPMSYMIDQHKSIGSKHRTVITQLFVHLQRWTNVMSIRFYQNIVLKAVARIFVLGIALPFPSFPSPPLPSPPHPSSPSPFLGAPHPLPARRSGECCKLPQRGSGRNPGRKRIFGHFCSSEMYLVAAISPLGACLCASS